MVKRTNDTTVHGEGGLVQPICSCWNTHATLNFYAVQDESFDVKECEDCVGRNGKSMDNRRGGPDTTAWS